MVEAASRLQAQKIFAERGFLSHDKAGCERGMRLPERALEVAGGEARYSDAAIQTTLMVRMAFRLAFRQTEGLMASVITLMDLTRCTY